MAAPERGYGGLGELSERGREHGRKGRRAPTSHLLISLSPQAPHPLCYSTVEAQTALFREHRCIQPRFAGILRRQWFLFPPTSPLSDP